MSILSYIPSLNYFNFIFDFPLVVVTTQCVVSSYFTPGVLTIQTALYVVIITTNI